jgi:hypothetical protein
VIRMLTIHKFIYIYIYIYTYFNVEFKTCFLPPPSSSYVFSKIYCTKIIKKIVEVAKSYVICFACYFIFG